MDRISVAGTSEKTPPLSPEEREMIEWAVDDFLGHPQEQKDIAVEQYREILTNFIEASKKIKLEHYMLKPSRKYGFSILSDVAVLPNILAKRHKFSSGFSQIHHDTIYMDAPFMYTIDLAVGNREHPQNETIGLIGFRIDLEHRILFIDQIQGGTTDPRTRTRTGVRARMRFKDGMPEYALYDTIRTFARIQGLRAIGIRKSKYSKNGIVHKLAKEGKKTIYEKVAQHFGHTEQRPFSDTLEADTYFPNTSEADAYTFERIA